MLLTLSIIFIISLLLVSCLRSILLFHKALNQQERQHQNFYQLEHTAQQLAFNRRRNDACIKTQDAANETIKSLIRGQGCWLSIDQMQYRYLIENLGDYPCLVLSNSKKKRATHHMRVSLLLVANEEHSASLLQLRIITAATTKPCVGEEHRVKEGISSWRYLGG